MIELHTGEILVKLRAVRIARFVEVVLSLAKHRENVHIALLSSSVLTFHKYLLMLLLVLGCDWMIAFVVSIVGRSNIVALLYQSLQQSVYTNAVVLAVEPKA